MADIIVLIVILGCAIAAATVYIKRKKSGKGCCGSCTGCNGGCKR